MPPEIEHRTSSPSRSHTPRLAPMPGGVPVMITVPAGRVVPWDKWEMSLWRLSVSPGHKITSVAPRPISLDSLGNGPNHVAGATILDYLSVKPSLEHEVVWVREECGRDEARTEREELIEAWKGSDDL